MSVQHSLLRLVADSLDELAGLVGRRVAGQNAVLWSTLLQLRESSAANVPIEYNFVFNVQA